MKTIYMIPDSNANSLKTTRALPCRMKYNTDMSVSRRKEKEERELRSQVPSYMFFRLLHPKRFLQQLRGVVVGWVSSSLFLAPPDLYATPLIEASAACIRFLPSIILFFESETRASSEMVFLVNDRVL